MPAMDAEIIVFLRRQGMFAGALRVQSAFEQSSEAEHLRGALKAARDSHHADMNGVAERMHWKAASDRDAIRDEALEDAAMVAQPFAIAARIRALKSTASATESHATALSAPPPPTDSGGVSWGAQEPYVGAQIWPYALQQDSAETLAGVPDADDGPHTWAYALKKSRDDDARTIEMLRAALKKKRQRGEAKAYRDAIRDEALEEVAEIIGDAWSKAENPEVIVALGSMIDAVEDLKSSATDVEAKRMAAASAHSDCMAEWRAGRDEKCHHGLARRDCKDCHFVQLVEPIAADWDDWVAMDVGK